MAIPLFDAEGRLSLDDKRLTGGLKAAKAKVQKTMREIDGMRAEAEIRGDSSQLNREIAAAKAKLRALDHEKATAELKVDVDKASRKIGTWEKKLRQLESRKVKVDVELSQRSRLTNRLLEGMARSLRRIRYGARDAEGPMTKLGKALHNARLTLGPLSLSLRGFMLLLAAAAPIVGGLVAAVGGLGAALGAGLTGGLGLAGSALIGFGGVAAGVFSILKAHPEAMKPLTEGLSKLGKEFTKQTKIPRAWGTAVKDGLSFAKELLPDFARLSENSLRSVSQGFSDVIASFRQNDLRGVLFGPGGLFTNAQKSIRPMVRGLGSLAQIAARVGRSFSRFFKPISEGFDNWAAGALKSISKGKGLDKTVDSLMASLGSLGKLTKESGRTLLNFFVAAGPAGRKMVGDITELVKKWGDWLSKAENQKKLNEWLLDGWETVKKLANALESLVKAFDKVRRAAKPVVDLLLDLGGSKAGGILMTALLGGVAIATGLRFLSWIARGIFKIGDAAGSARRGVRALGVSLKGLRSPKAVEVKMNRTPDPLRGMPKETTVRVRAQVPKGEAARVERAIKPRGPVRPAVKPKVDPSDSKKIESDIRDAGRKGGASGGKAATQALKENAPKGGVQVGRSILRGMGAAFSRGNLALLAASMAVFPDEVGQTFREKISTTLPEAVKDTFWKMPSQVSAVVGQSMDKILKAGFLKLPSGGAHGAGRFGQQRAFLQALGFSKDASGDAQQVRSRLLKVRNNIQSAMVNLGKTPKGLNFIATVSVKGGKEAQTTLARLAQTRLGRKLLQILSQGGPGAVRLMGQLQKTRLGRKLLQIIERGGRPAAAIVSRLSNAKIRQKVLRILERGGKNAEKQLAKLLGYKNLGTAIKEARARDRATKVLNRIKAMANLGLASKDARARDHATAILNRIKALNDLGTATKTIVTRAVNIVSQLPGIGGSFGRRGAAGFSPGRRSDGGATAEPAGQMARLQDIQKALGRAAMPPSGGRVIASTFLRNGDIVGEEGGEWVIPESPRYRGRALKLLSDAAESLGVRAFKKGRKPTRAERRAAAKRRRAAAKKRRERRQRAADKRFISKHHLGGINNLTGPVDSAEADAEEAEHDYGISERNYRRLAEDHPVMNEDGTVNQANISWHDTNIGQLVQELTGSVIKAYENVRYQVALAQKRVFRMMNVLNAWDPKSSWGEGKRKDWMEELDEAGTGLKESDRSARWSIDDRRGDVSDLEHERAVIKGTQPEKGAGGDAGGTAGDGSTFQEQLGAFNQARNELFQQMGGNSLGAEFAKSAFGGGSGGTVQQGAMAGALAAAGLGVAGGAVISALLGGGGATAKAGAAGIAAAPTAGGVTLNQVNNYAAPPPDPHTFSQDVKYEIQHAI